MTEHDVIQWAFEVIGDPDTFVERYYAPGKSVRYREELEFAVRVLAAMTTVMEGDEKAEEFLRQYFPWI